MTNQPYKVKEFRVVGEGLGGGTTESRVVEIPADTDVHTIVNGYFEPVPNDTPVSDWVKEG